MSVADIDAYIADVASSAPDGDAETIINLAEIYRLMAHYRERLHTDVGDAVAAEWLRKLTGEARHLRAELGISGKSKTQSDGPQSIRRA